MREILDNLGLIKISNFAYVMGSVKRKKREVIDWEKLCAGPILDKVLVFKMYKTLTNSMKTINPIKMGPKA